MRVLMPLMRSLNWMRIYLRKALPSYCPMIMIVSGYTFSRYSSMENPDRMEWVPNSLCDNPSLSLPKDSVPALSDSLSFVRWSFFLKLYPDHVHLCVTHVPEYESSRMMISSQMCIGKRVVSVRHCVTVAFLTPFFCMRNVWETLSARWRISLLWEISLRFL